jgi:hypothetical protein
MVVDLCGPRIQQVWMGAQAFGIICLFAGFFLAHTVSFIVRKLKEKYGSGSQ